MAPRWGFPVGIPETVPGRRELGEGSGNGGETAGRLGGGPSIQNCWVFPCRLTVIFHSCISFCPLFFFLPPDVNPG